jgi:hypothetical protein
MGAFCVFGISRTACLAAATKRVLEFEVVDGVRHYLTLEQWAAKRDLVAEQLFQSGARAIKVSPEFDAPQFCHDWLAIDPNHVRLAGIRVRGGQAGQAWQPGRAQRPTRHHVGRIQRGAAAA